MLILYLKHQQRKTTMETINLSKYIERRDRMIAEIINVTKTVWCNDNEMLDIAVLLTTALQVADPAQEFVDDLYGFMMWAGMKGEITGRALSTILHDLGEFKNNRDKNWFCPRTTGYSKYLSGASGVKV
jgi:hypothetical protein